MYIVQYTRMLRYTIILFSEHRVAFSSKYSSQNWYDGYTYTQCYEIRSSYIIYRRVSCLLLFWIYVKLTWFESKLPKTERDEQNLWQLPSVSYTIRWSSIDRGGRFFARAGDEGCSKLKLMHALNNIEWIIIYIRTHTQTSSTSDCFG